MAGILLAALLLLLEHLYFQYVRKHLAKSDRGGCCALISLSMGKSLTFRGAVFEAQDILKNHRCRDPICDTHLWKVKHDLDMSQMRVKELEKELESHGIKPPPKRWVVWGLWGMLHDRVVGSFRNFITKLLFAVFWLVVPFQKSI